MVWVQHKMKFNEFEIISNIHFGHESILVNRRMFPFFKIGQFEGSDESKRRNALPAHTYFKPLNKEKLESVISLAGEFLLGPSGRPRICW